MTDSNLVPMPALAQNESAALISIIQRAASDPTVDIEKMERLFQMHERIEKRRAEAAYNTAMAEAQAEMPAVVRNKENSHTHSKYADLYAIADAALPVVHKHGFGLSFSECKSDQHCIGVACRVSHSGGHSERYEFNIPADKAGSQGKVNKTDIQAYGSARTYGRRYATVDIFNIPIRDADGNAPQATITEAQADALADALTVDDVDIPAFCRYFKIQKFGDLPAAKYSSALRMIEERKKKATGASA